MSPGGAQESTIYAWRACWFVTGDPSAARYNTASRMAGSRRKGGGQYGSVTLQPFGSWRRVLAYPGTYVLWRWIRYVNRGEEFKVKRTKSSFLHGKSGEKWRYPRKCEGGALMQGCCCPLYYKVDIIGRVSEGHQVTGLPLPTTLYTRNYSARTLGSYLGYLGPRMLPYLHLPQHEQLPTTCIKPAGHFSILMMIIESGVLKHSIFLFKWVRFNDQEGWNISFSSNDSIRLDNLNQLK